MSKRRLAILLLVTAFDLTLCIAFAAGQGPNAAAPTDHGTSQAARSGARNIRIALVSNKCIKGDVQANLQSHERWLRRAVEAGAFFIGFPECSLTGYEYEKNAGIARDSAAIRRLGELARQHNVWIAAGFLEQDGAQKYNSCVLLGFDGTTRFVRKINLAGKENKHLARGSAFSVYDLGACKLGIAICSDATYPETIRALALGGAEMIFVPHATYLAGTPASWLKWRKDAWSIFAPDALVVIAGTNNAGLSETPVTNEEDYKFAGGAIVVNEQGAVVAESGLPRNTETMLLAEVNIEAVRKARRESPFFASFRAELFYGSILAK